MGYYTKITLKDVRVKKPLIAYVQDRIKGIRADTEEFFYMLEHLQIDETGKLKWLGDREGKWYTIDEMAGWLALFCAGGFIIIKDMEGEGFDFAYQFDGEGYAHAVDVPRRGAQNRAAGKGPESSAAHALIQILKNQKAHALVRAAAAEALGELGPQAKPAVRALSRTLSDEDSAVAALAAVSLARIDPTAAKTAVPILIGALEDIAGPLENASEGFRASIEALGRASIEALGYIGPAAKEATPALQSLLSCGDTEAKRSTEEALQKIQVQVLPTRKKGGTERHRHKAGRTEKK